MYCVWALNWLKITLSIAQMSKPSSRTLKRKGIIVEKHITIIAVLNIGLSIVSLIVAIIVFTAIVGGGILSGDEEAMRITSIVGTILGGFIAVLAIPGIIAGFGLLKRQPWARLLTMIVAVMDLLYIPFGTALGIYTLWVLLQDESNAILSASDAS
jgi:hypothetical protein